MPINTTTTNNSKPKPKPKPKQNSMHFWRSWTNTTVTTTQATLATPMTPSRQLYLSEWSSTSWSLAFCSSRSLLAAAASANRKESTSNWRLKSGRPRASSRKRSLKWRSPMGTLRFLTWFMLASQSVSQLMSIMINTKCTTESILSHDQHSCESKQRT